MATAIVSAAPPAVRRIASVVVPAILVAVVNATLAFTQILSPAQPGEGHRFTRSSDFLIEYQFAASLLLATVAVLALADAHRRRADRWGTFGTAASVLYAVATGLFGISAAVTAIRGTESLDVIQFPAILLWLVSGLLMAIVTIRARLLPVIVGIGFAVSLPATMALGDAGPLALAVLWFAVAATARHRR